MPHSKSPAPLRGGHGALETDQAGTRIEEDNSSSPVLAQSLALPIPEEDQVRWLIAQGVSDEAMLSPWLLKAASVKFLGGGTFEFNDRDGRGERAIVFRANDHGEPIDLLAWSARTNRLASWRGAAFCLGDVDDCFNPGSWALGGGLRVHLTPLDWLKADRDGIVIVNPALSYSCLRNRPRLVVGDALHAKRIQQWIKPPKPCVEIHVEVPAAEREAA